jgi:ribosomal protein L24
MGDEVKVISGSQKGTTGKVLKIIKKKGKMEQVVVEGVNFRTKHKKPTKEGEQGNIVKKEFPIHESNVKVVSRAESEAPGTVETRSPEPVMRIRSRSFRSWVPFMSAAGEEEVAEAEADVDDEVADKAGRTEPDVSAWQDADPKEWVTGKVQSIQSYGAFVTLPDEQTGLLHISQMAEGFVDDPNDVVSEGDEIKVRVINVDMEKGNIALSLKEPQAGRAPRQGGGGGDRAAKAEILQGLAETADEKVFVPATVTNIASFGAFVKLEQGVEGLVHISQLQEGFLEDVNEVVSVGDEVQVRIEDVDLEKSQLKLSMLPWKEGSGGKKFSGGGDSGGGDFDDFGDFTPDGFDGDNEMEEEIASEPISDEDLAKLQILDEENAKPSWLDVALENDEKFTTAKKNKEKYVGHSLYDDPDTSGQIPLDARHAKEGVRYRR